MSTYARRYLNLEKQTKSDSMYKPSEKYEARLNDIMERYVGKVKIGDEEKIITGYGLLLILRDAYGIKPILEDFKSLGLINDDLSLTDKGKKAIEENKKVAFEELQRDTEGDGDLLK